MKAKKFISFVLFFGLLSLIFGIKFIAAAGIDDISPQCSGYNNNCANEYDANKSYCQKLLLAESEQEAFEKYQKELLEKKKREKIKIKKKFQKRSPKELYSGYHGQGARDLLSGKKILIPLNASVVNQYGLPINELTVEPGKIMSCKGGKFYKPTWSFAPRGIVQYGNYEVFTKSNLVLDGRKNSSDRTLSGTIKVTNKGFIDYKLVFPNNHVFYYKKEGNDLSKEKNMVDCLITWIPN